MAHTALLILGFTSLAQATGAQSTAGGSNQLVLWAIVLLGMALALFIAELFVPSGGVFGIFSVLCLIGGIIMLFWVDTTLGLIGIIVSLFALPFAFAGALWIWPSTPIGRALTLGGNEDEPESDLDGQQAIPIAVHQSEITPGTEGETLTDLRPVGLCLLNGKRQECLSASGVIESGVRVRVVAADGMQIKVQTIHDS